ncbi:MAG: PorP/SprF family type IX secretion system membrane protein [Chitinophagales bacterium]
MKSCLCIALCLLRVLFLSAQDMHFSQFFAAPLQMNPASTGNFTGIWRVGLNYRDQWGSVTIPYRTYDLYTDASIQPKSANNNLGLGGYLLNDVAGDGELTTTKAIASAAYHLQLADDDSYKISVGMSGGMVLKQIDFTKLTFDSQWDGHDFDPSLSNNESTISDNLDYLDFSMGAIFTVMPYSKEKYFLGVAAHHVNEPDASFYDVANTIGMRITANAGAFFPLNNAISLHSQVYYSTQKQDREIILGDNASFAVVDTDNAKSFFAGAWYRYADAAWLLMGLSMANITFSASYDFNFSGLTVASHTLGGLELAIVYTLLKGEKKNPLNCPAYE